METVNIWPLVGSAFNAQPILRLTGCQRASISSDFSEDAPLIPHHLLVKRSKMNTTHTKIAVLSVILWKMVKVIEISQFWNLKLEIFKVATRVSKRLRKNLNSDWMRLMSTAVINAHIKNLETKSSETKTVENKSVIFHEKIIEIFVLKL